MPVLQQVLTIMIFLHDPVNNSWTQKSSFSGSARFGTHGTNQVQLLVMLVLG